MNPPKLALVIPFYNEEEIILDSVSEFCALLKNLKDKNEVAKDSFILFVDDGSTDLGYKILCENMQDSVFVLKLSGNKGHQNALLAGLHFVKDKCDACISIDCDLEQDVYKISDFLKAYKNGANLVLGVRNDRKSDGIFKKLSASIFYKTMNFFGAKTIPHHADYRLLSKKALEFLGEYGEVNLFLRALILELGFRPEIVYYDMTARQKGKSKYSLKKMLSLALNGITSFSNTPLRLVFFAGLFISILSAILGVYGIIIALFTTRNVPGWASIVVPIYFLGGIQMLSIGIIGEYVGKIYSEAKRRPRYFIEEVRGFDRILKKKDSRGSDKQDENRDR